MIALCTSALHSLLCLLGLAQPRHQCSLEDLKTMFINPVRNAARPPVPRVPLFGGSRAIRRRSLAPEEQGLPARVRTRRPSRGPTILAQGGRGAGRLAAARAVFAARTGWLSGPQTCMFMMSVYADTMRLRTLSADWKAICDFCIAIMVSSRLTDSGLSWKSCVNFMASFWVWLTERNAWSNAEPNEALPTADLSACGSPTGLAQCVKQGVGERRCSVDVHGSAPDGETLAALRWIIVQKRLVKSPHIGFKRSRD